jgi:hypothetical protein
MQLEKQLAQKQDEFNNLQKSFNDYMESSKELEVSTLYNSY